MNYLPVITCLFVILQLIASGQEPSLKETREYLEQKIPALLSMTRRDGTKDTDWSAVMAKFDGDRCEIFFEDTLNSGDKNRLKWSIPLSRLNLDGLRLIQPHTIHIETIGNERVIALRRLDRALGDRDSSSLDLYCAEEEMAARIIKAIRRAAFLFGAKEKRDPFK